ncbi:MAG: redox-regulated ATPase YchF, partial [Rickettsiales bacterium]
GNTGAEYENTRHNIGYKAIDIIEEMYRLSKSKNKFNSEINELVINNHKIMLSKPLNYVNNSGIAVGQISRYYNIPQKNIIVIHDDLDIIVGKFKIKIGGGSGGHNGIKSIDSDITHVEDTIDPVRDVELIETELIFADLESIEKRIPALEKKAKLNDKLAIDQISLLKRVKEKLLEGKLAIETDIGIDTLKSLQLLTSKPILYVCNVLEDEALNGNILSNDMIKFAEKNNRIAIIISSKIESEISMLDTQGEKDDFISDLGLSETGLSQIIRKGYNLLNLSTFFTIGPKEARSWTIQNGSQAPSAAGVIHSDFERGFIRAEVIAYDDYIKYNGEAGSKEAGKFRVEGKEYIVRDGDVLHFRFNV